MGIVSPGAEGDSAAQRKKEATFKSLTDFYLGVGLVLLGGLQSVGQPCCLIWESDKLNQAWLCVELHHFQKFPGNKKPRGGVGSGFSLSAH